MKRTCNLDTLIRENDDRHFALRQDEEMSDALRDAIQATRKKIDNAFSSNVKYHARLKDVHI